MHYLYEQGDLLNSPYEAFIFDTTVHSFPVKQHWHYYMEAIYVINGSISASFDDKNYILSTGDLMIIPPKAMHGFSHIHSDNPVDTRYYVIKFDLGRFHERTNCIPQLKSIILEAGISDNTSVFFSKEDLAGYPIADYFKTCTDEFHNKSYGYHTFMHATLACLLFTVIRIWKSNGFTPSDQYVQPDDNSIDHITEYIDSHSNQPILVEDLANRCNMSYSFFAKKFKQLYGRSCKEYIEYVRVIKAQDMLLFTDYDLTYISQETGFSDCSHMIKTFKKQKGITPKQFRLQNIKGASNH